MVGARGLEAEITSEPEGNLPPARKAFSDSVRPYTGASDPQPVN
jgi:hypothetical protein